MSVNVVETRNLTKVYRDFWGRKKKTALNALDLDIYKGEIFGLLGPNGSGKTTTIKLLLGLLFPTAGDALVFGEPAAKVEKNERIGYLPEESYLYRFLNAEETLDFYGRLFKIDAETRRRRAAELIETVGLANDKKRILKEYSKGMRQRIGLAQALINDPDLIILDEPTSGLDPLGTRWMKDLILDLKTKGKTILMCSHRLDDVQDVCDRIAILYNGDLQELGKVDRLVEDQKRLEVRATDLEMSDTLKDELSKLFAKHGGKLESFGHPTTTLEDLFLRIVQESKDRPGRRFQPKGRGVVPRVRPFHSGSPAMSLSVFGILILDRDPIGYGDFLGLVQAWLQDAGGFAAVGLAIYILYAMFAGSEASPSNRDRMAVSRWMVLMGVLALACYLVLFVLLILKKGGDPNEMARQIEPGYTYRYEPPKLQTHLRAILLTAGGLFAVLGIGQPFARDLLKLRFQRVWALSKLGFKEAVRNKLFWVFLLCLLPFLFPAKWFVSDIKAEDELRWTVNLSTFMAAILTIVPAALLAAFAIPNDIKNQTIYTIVTKPVERFEVVLGRFFGYTGLMTVALALMSTVSLVFIWSTKIDDAAKAETYRARVPLRGTLSFKARKSDFSGTLVGREFEYRKYIAGDRLSPQRAIWNFATIPTSLSDDRPGDSVPCEFAFDIFRLTKGEENRGVDISLRVTTWKCPQAPPTELRDGTWKWEDPAKQQQYETEANEEYQKLVQKARDERRPTPPALAAARPGTETWGLVNRLAEKYGFYEIRGKEIYDYHPDSIPIPVGLFKNARDGTPVSDKEGKPLPRVQVAVKCESPSQLLGMAAADLYILEGDKSYGENYFRATFGLWCRVVMVIGIAVALSTYLAGVIALLGAFFLFLSGYFAEHIDDLAKGTSVGGGPFKSLTNLLEAKMPTAIAEETARAKAASILDAGYGWVIRRFSNLVPDVEGFSWSHFLGEGFNVNFEFLVMNFVVLVGYLLPWGVLAYYLMRSREVAN